MDMVNHGRHGHGEGVFPRFLCYYLIVFLVLFTGGRGQWYLKDATTNLKKEAKSAE